MASITAPCVTVIIPLYNKADYIQRALDSVLAQTYADFRVIVVDDGSTDGGADTVRRCLDPRVRLIVQANAGVSATRNCGAEEARTEWLAFLDADDEWLPTFLERTSELAHTHPLVTAIMTDITFTDIRPSAEHRKQEFRILNDYFQQSMDYGRLAIGHISSTLVCRKTFAQLGGFPVGVGYHEDLDLFARFAWKGDIGFLSEILAMIHTDPHGAQSKAQRTGGPYPDILKTYALWREANRIPEHLRRSSRAYFNLIRLRYAARQLAAGNARVARRILLRECRPPRREWPRYLRLLVVSSIPESVVRRIRMGKNMMRVQKPHAKPSL